MYISLTNDGNAILREIDVAHPAAKNMIELSRTQDEECGDGTTSVIVLGALVCPLIYLSVLTSVSRSRGDPRTVPFTARARHPSRSDNLGVQQGATSRARGRL